MKRKIDEINLIIRASIMGDKVAFGILVERYSLSLRRFLCNLTHDDELAKDITQEAFIKAWLSISTFKAASSFQTWLYRIAYNIYYDHLKRQKNIYQS